MKFVSCKGYMIPGMDFESGYSIWFLRWIESPTDSKSLSEVWCFHPDGKRVCYIDPKEKVGFFRKYHSFDEVTGADIGVKETADEIRINVNDELHITIKTGFSLAYSLINHILSEKHKVVGRTETGKVTENIPHKMIGSSRCQGEIRFQGFRKAEEEKQRSDGR